MEANAGESFQMQIYFLNIFPCIGLHCKLVPVQYWEYQYDLITSLGTLQGLYDLRRRRQQKRHLKI